MVELGCGEQSIFEQLSLSHKVLMMEAYDINELSINSYKKRASTVSRLNDVTFRVGDVLELCLDSSVKCFIDSHLIHCLDNRAQMSRYLDNLYTALVENGFVALEVMCSNSAFKKAYQGQLDDGYLKRYNRHVLYSHEWEKLFIDSGFKIEVFRILKGFKLLFLESDEGLSNEAALKSDPDVLQIILRK